MSTGPTPRDHNKAAVLDVVLSQAPLTRNSLIELTHLSKATVSRTVEELRSDGFVVEQGVDTAIGRGRRSAYLDVPGTAGHIVGISLGAQSTCVLVTDLRGREVEHVTVSTIEEDEVEIAAKWLVGLMAQTSVCAEGPLRQIVVATPGRKGDETLGAPESGRVFAASDLQRALEDLVQAPVLLDSDANASLREILAGGARIGNAALFTLSTRMNFASCTGHEIARGRTPAFGDVGVLFSGVDGETLEGLMTVPGLLRFARARGLDLERVESLWLEPHAQTARAEVLEAFTTSIVTAVTVVAVTLDPESVFFVGRLSPLVDEVLPEARRRLARTLPAVPGISVVKQVLGLSVAQGAARAGQALTQNRLRDSVLNARRTGQDAQPALPAAF